jgi:outer membrane protein assembly factor BamB
MEPSLWTSPDVGLGSCHVRPARLPRRCRTTLLLTWVILLSQSTVQAGDWTTVHHDAQRTGRTPDCVRGNYRVEWIRSFPGEAICTRVEAIVAQGKVYVGTLPGTLWALDRRTGEVVWKHHCDGSIQHSPAFAEGRVYVGDTGGTLWALEAASGKPLWRFRSGKGGFVAAPLVAAGTVFLGSRDGTFYAVDAATGQLRWKFATGGPIRSTAALAGSRVLFASDDMHAYALRADNGQLLWKSERLYGQSFRDYYPVVLDDHRVLFRSVLVEEMNEELNGGTHFLQRLAGIPPGWKELENFLQSDRNRGSPELIRTEQRAIVQRLEENPYRRTCFILDLDTGRELSRAPILYIAGNQGCGIPPVLSNDGRVIVFYRTVYSNWNLGVKPAVGLGVLQTDEQKNHWITPLRHRQGNRPPWNTFWGTCDETTNFSVGGDLLYCCHQGTLSAFDLKTGDLFPIAGERDTWGGLLAPIWAANEWHGPARGAVAISDDQLFWVTGSRVICIRGNLPKDAPREPLRSTETRLELFRDFRPSTGFIDAARLIAQTAQTRPKVNIPDTPATRELKADVAREVQELIAGWPWAPWYVQMGIGSRDFYFAHPSYAVQALAWAYPHLPDDLAQQAKSLAVRQLEACLQPDSLPLEQGRRRELFAVPMHALSWSYHPRWPPMSHLYALWLYGERTGDWNTIEKLWPRIRAAGRQYLAKPLEFDGQQRGHLYLNRTAAGVLAYARLAHRFGASDDAMAATQELDRLLREIVTLWRNKAALAVKTLEQSTSKGDITGNPGRKFYFHLNNHKSKLALFLDMTPELGQALAETAPAESEALRRVLELLMPTYSLAWEERCVHYGENFVDLPDSMHGLFLTHAFVWKASAERLVRDTDLPWVKADLFHIEKLVHALEAHGRQAER